MNPTQEQLDQQAVALSKAIRSVESDDNFNAKGGSGEYGAYQYMPETWKARASKYGINVPIEQATPEQQNEVTYRWVKEKKDAGYNPGQIASMHNAGEGKPEAYQSGHKGVNAKGVAYDTPEYARKVATKYQEFKGGGVSATEPQTGYRTQPSLPEQPVTPTTQEQTGQPQEKTLGGLLSKRVSDISQAVTDTTKGKQNIVSGVLQTVGGVAGGIGDIVGKGIELIPGVKTLEKWVGKGAEKLAQTDTGQEVLKSINQFSKDHPELSKDIGAGINIVSAIPILKGAGMALNVAKDAASIGLKKTAEKAMEKGLESVAKSTVRGRNALSNNPTGLKKLIAVRALPDVVDGKFSTEEAYNKLSNAISVIENTELQPTLARASTQAVAQREPLETLRKRAIEDVRRGFRGTGDSVKAEMEINRKFDGFKNEYGDYVTIQDINDMKRGVRTRVNFASPLLDQDVAYQLGQVFQHSVEDMAGKLGLGDVKTINQRMAELIKAQDMLKHIEGKNVKLGTVGNIIKDSATVGGEMAGNLTGIPLAGAYIGRQQGGFVGKKLTNMSAGILKRTGKGAERTSAKDIYKKGKGLIKGLLGQQVTQINQNQNEKKKTTPQ